MRTMKVVTMGLWALVGWASGAAAQSAALDEAIATYDDGRRADAVPMFEQLLDSRHEAQARLFLGRIFHGWEEWDEAEDHLERAYELEPDNADIAYALGLTYMDHIQDVSLLGKRGQANKALNQLVATLYIDPGHVDARVSLASYYLNAPGIVGGSKERAREQVEAILQLDPKRGHLFQAEVHENAEEWDEAWVSYESALRVAPTDPQVLYLSGMFKQGREEWTEAVKLFERAAAEQMVPENREWVRASLYQMGRTGALSGENLERARDALIEFSQRFPGREDALSAGAHWRLGMIYEMQGEVALARSAYEAALQMDPDNEQAKDALKRLGG